MGTMYLKPCVWMVQVCLPGCDVCDLVKSQPILFLGSEPSVLMPQIAESYGQLNEQLPACVDVDAVVHEQPTVLFQSRSTLRSALQQVQFLHLEHIDPADTARLLLHHYQI